MDRLDSDLVALATTPAPRALQQLESALRLQEMLEQQPMGWPLRGALAGTALALGLALGLGGNLATAAPQPLPIALITGGSALLPSTLLASQP